VWKGKILQSKVSAFLFARLRRAGPYSRLHGNDKRKITPHCLKNTLIEFLQIREKSAITLRKELLF